MEIKSMDDAVRAYRKVEATLEAKETEYKAATAKYRQALEQLELCMIQFLRQAGVDSMNIVGLAEVKIVNKRTFGCADWDLFYKWIAENNLVELLWKRIHEGNMQHWIDEHGGATLPPAVNVHTEAILKVLKGK